MGFIGVFPYVCIVYFAQIHPISLIPSSPPNSHSFAFISEKNRNFYMNIYLSLGHLTFLFTCFIQFAPISL